LTAAARTGGDVESILVIEDEGMLARLLVGTLETAGFDVTTAGDGRRGLELAREGSFNLVVLDLMLPDVDGLSVLGRLREHCPHLQVLVLSGVAEVQSKVRCLEAGACDYVTKPFDPLEFVARVRVRAREQRRPQAARMLARDGFCLDLQTRMVTAGGTTSDLSTREFALLWQLMENSGEVCRRQDLLEKIWGYTFDPSTNVLDVYIARLRQKLGGDAIQTVRNVGYSFVGG
jgi:DNA-binding response OmpR family regulator